MTTAKAPADQTTLASHLLDQARTVEEIFRFGRYKNDEFPAEAYQNLLNYVTIHNITYNEEEYGAYLSGGKGSPILIFVRGNEILRLARLSGLYIPGKVRHYTVGRHALCEASCYTRFSQTDSNWFEVSESANWDSYCDRDMDQPFVADKSPIPIGNWAINGLTQLALAAQVLAARKALGAYLTQHLTVYDQERSVSHHLRQLMMKEEAERKRAAQV